MSDIDKINVDKLTLDDSEAFFLELLGSAEWNYRKKTIKTYKFNINDFINYIETKREKQLVRKITKEDVATYFQHLRRKNLSHNTIYNRYSTVKLFFLLLQDYGVIKKTPIADYKLRKSRARKKEREARKRKTIPLTQKQTRILLDFIRNYKREYSSLYLRIRAKKIKEQEKNMIEIGGKKWKPIYLRDYLLISLLYATGMRKVELLSVTKKQVDLDGHLFKGVERKGGVIQDIIMTDLIEHYVYGGKKHLPDNYTSERDLLKAYLENNDIGENERIFPVHESNVNKRFELYGSKIPNFPHLFPHLLRHTFGSHISSIGINPFHIKLMMAHETITTTEGYVQPEFQSIAEDWRKIGLYSGQVTPDLEKKEVSEK